MTKFVFQGTGHTTGGNGLAKVAVAAVAAVALAGSSAAGAAASGAVAAITDLVYWVAGVMGTAVVVGSGLLAWWLVTKPAREARAAAIFAENRRRYEAEVEERRTARAVTAAQAQAQVLAPLVAALAASHPPPWPQPEAQPVRIVRREVEP